MKYLSDEEILAKNKIGAHLSTAGNILNTFKQAKDLQVQCFACFTAPPLRYNTDTRLDPLIASEFQSTAEKFNFLTFSHASYLINICSTSKPTNYEKSINAICAELERCNVLGIKGTAIHPGSNPNSDEGISILCKTLNEIMLDYNGKAELLLEPSAGQGGTLPCKIEHMEQIYDGLTEKSKKHTKFVIDTCHTHASGYDLSTKDGALNFFTEFDEKIGIENISLLHINDSKKECGSNLDRHENITKGTIGKSGFEGILKLNKISEIPKILETPVKNYLDWKIDIEDILRILKSS